jgi:hypothetical protein
VVVVGGIVEVVEVDVDEVVVSATAGVVGGSWVTTVQAAADSANAARRTMA